MLQLLRVRSVIVPHATPPSTARIVVTFAVATQRYRLSRKAPIRFGTGTRVDPHMKEQRSESTSPQITTLEELATRANYSLIATLVCDPDAAPDGANHTPRQVFTGHYVPVTPTPIAHPRYVAHSTTLFHQLGLADEMAHSADFVRMFSGDLSQLPAPLRKVGWATGYALSIYGTEYYQQCPFKTGNGYGDGRAISVLETVIDGQRWEMQLKGGGRTPYCRGADGRAVLRSSVREFLAQEHMHALGVPTSRSLSLYVSGSEMVRRPWYSHGSYSTDPDMMVAEAVAITTRVAPSFLRVGQLELFGRRARKQEHPHALQELEAIVLHLIAREYATEIDSTLPLAEKVVLLAQAFRHRLTALVAHWIRVGFCQGNFNSDNCAAGGFTLDYGPFGFCEVFNPYYQPWTGGGDHFAFLNQPAAAERNFLMFCSALEPLVASHPQALQQLAEIRRSFATEMESQLEAMWAAKLGLDKFNAELFSELMTLMVQTPVDYTLFFRELSKLPDTIEPLKKSFYKDESHSVAAIQPSYFSNPEEMERRWCAWLMQWRSLINSSLAETPSRTLDEIAREMEHTNPKYVLREWQLAPSYQLAAAGDYTLIHELQAVMTQPYDEQSSEVAEKYYRQKPSEFCAIGGVSHLSCSS